MAAGHFNEGQLPLNQPLAVQSIESVTVFRVLPQGVGFPWHIGCAKQVKVGWMLVPCLLDAVWIAAKFLLAPNHQSQQITVFNAQFAAYWVGLFGQPAIGPLRWLVDP